MPKKSASTLVQTYWPLAVGVAGAIWAISTFWFKEAPLLAARVAGSSTLTWSAPPDLCRAYFNVELENSGLTAFSVNKVRVRAWLVDPPSLKGAGVLFLDVPGSLNKTSPLTDVVYSADPRDANAVPHPLVATYYAGMKYKHRFEWDMPRTEQRNFYVYVELFAPGSGSQTAWYFSGWSQVCESLDDSGDSKDEGQPKR